MKRITILFFIIIISLMPSCNIDNINEINEEYANSTPSKSIEREMCVFNIDIINKTNDVTLTFTEFKIYGLEEEQDTIKGDFIINPLDTLNLISYEVYPQTLPNDSKVIMKGSLKNGDYTLYDGIIIIPIRKTITHQDNKLNLALFGGCDWYTEDGYGILASISFDITVNPWYDEDVNI